MSQEVAGFDDDSGLPPAVVEGIQTFKAGVVSTAVMLFIFLVSEAETDFNLGVPAAIAKFVGMDGEPYLGFAVFVVAGVVVWPLLFAAIEDRFKAIPGGDDIGVRGILFALLLWVAFLGLGSAGLQLEGAFFFLYIVFSLLAHLAYGYSLGVFYGRFTR
ncbi:hypothetical protein ZOD2009_13546 [Haladaptatus paucihalophilus DX253]|uniref:Uncharacterized protein n=1 Tax=Haladaptatus paucihalophilus DX253 TaxID=797209 RepID=E7QV73_HALPU|nr:MULTISPECIES: DUF6789 family protein [Haladaptatus]EFW91591.1 hypothetical protein ZOD2009_13546 [Haladaptatus paucihalophilus DX253]GKZ16137.1 hypothetical protein HAL_40180 [Haladaptatus sp. T7]SHL23661.1 hypothetical protein SAMN05444342_3373 [Haladaptatus paucihalophilus DX253]